MGTSQRYFPKFHEMSLAPGDSLSVITWHVRCDGLNIWRDGVLVAVIGHDKFLHVIDINQSTTMSTYKF